jgi:hypothetical protein
MGFWFNTQTMNPLSDQICPGCGQGNACAIAAGRSATACWCMESPAGLPVPTDDSACYCATCLRALAEKTHDGEATTDAC